MHRHLLSGHFPSEFHLEKVEKLFIYIKYVCKLAVKYTFLVGFFFIQIIQEHVSKIIISLFKSNQSVFVQTVH